MISFTKKGLLDWENGKIYFSFFVWGIDEDDNEFFSYSEEFLDNKVKTFDKYFNKKFMINIYAGGFGIKQKENNYYMFFDPEGINNDDLDIKKERSNPNLPYGCLIGKLGKSKESFYIGDKIEYKNFLNNKKIYILTDDGEFILQTNK